MRFRLFVFGAIAFFFSPQLSVFAENQTALHRPSSAPTTKSVKKDKLTAEANVPASRRALTSQKVKTSTRIFKPTIQKKQPASAPASIPTSRPFLRKNASSKPLSQPTSRLAGSSLPSKLGKKYSMPEGFGLFSIALTEKEKVWLDGEALGVAPFSSLRMATGQHKMVIRHSTYGIETTHFNIRENHHMIAFRRRRRAKTFFRSSRVGYDHVFVRHYPGKGQKLSEKRLLPGPYCYKASKCFFLAPGDHLYLRAGLPPVLLPSEEASRNAKAYPPSKKDGFLSIFAFPTGVLFLDGRAHALVPIANLPIKPGKHQIKVLNNFLGREWTGSLEIKAGQRIRKVVVLSPKNGGSLQIITKKPARIYVNGLFRGWTPNLSIPVFKRENQVTLRSPGMPELRKKVSVQKASVLLLNLAHPISR